MSTIEDFLADAVASKLTTGKSSPIELWIFVQYDKPGNQGIALALTQEDALKIAENNIRSRARLYNQGYDVEELLAALKQRGIAITKDLHTFVVQSRPITSPVRTW